VHEEPLADVAAIPETLDDWSMVWINVVGLGDEATLRQIAERFGLHRLAVEDVVNVHQRPKVEAYGELLFIVIRKARYTEFLESEQVSLFLGDGFVLTFQERSDHSFEGVRERIRHGRGRIRHAGADYLAYALIDAVVDGYYPVLERYGERIEALEGEVLEQPTPSTVRQVHQMKRELLALRRAIWPKRDAINLLLRDENGRISDETRIHLRDCYDHTIQIIDMLETLRELASGLMDMYLSSVGHRMNEIMKVLTIFAAIFIPLSFIAGLYGMNFDTSLPGNMPETKWPYGYFVALGLMAAVASGLLLCFRHMGWIGTGHAANRRDVDEGSGHS
jgi:magnesium transporter